MNIKKLVFPHDEKPGHFKALDGLRGLAVLFVLMSHMGNKGIVFHKLIDFRGSGKYGVYLFFVLSSYLLDKQIIEKMKSGTADFHYWLNYTIRRTLRIYPLFAIALVANHILISNGQTYAIDISSQDIIDHLLLQKGEAIFWSIPVEFLYYLLSPLIMLLFFKVYKWNLWAVFITMLIIIGVATYGAAEYDLSKHSLLRFLPIFIVGSFLAVLESQFQKQLESLGKSKKRLLNIAAIMAFLIILISIPPYFKNLFGYYIDFKTYHYYTVYGLLWALILCSAKYGGGILERVLKWTGFRYFGVLSFSIYLLHLPVIFYFSNVHMSTPLKSGIVIAIVVMVATVSYFLIERPLSFVRLQRNKKE